MTHDTIKELAALSSGTMATITGERNLDSIQNIQSKIINRAADMIEAGKMAANLNTVESLCILGVTA